MGGIRAVTDLLFNHDAAALPRGGNGSTPVLMYGRRPPQDGTASIGGPVLAAVRRIGIPVHRRAFDLLTVAMAVTAADTFVDRLASDDGWCRELHLEVPLSDPASWKPVLANLEAALGFLSGDKWSIDFVPGGPDRPVPQKRGRLTRLAGHDCVCLFSGGLDSTIGVLDIMAADKRPVLISHSYRGDAGRQGFVRARLPVSVSQFAAIANPVSRLEEDNDVQMRTRSFNFLAYGAIVAATMSEHHIVQGPVDLHVPENGLIALNPPLTRRRIGSLSTRTTHPHFLFLMQRILDDLEIPVRIITRPYDTMTKGEMLTACADQTTLVAVAAHTVSCGKWKRTGQQCGRCVPCLIRRAAFHGAGMEDATGYAPEGQDLADVMTTERFRDDLLAMILAARQMPKRDVGRWVAQSGPLSTDRTERDKLIGVANRGMAEVTAYLDNLGLLV
jgi:hypothetical protein